MLLISNFHQQNINVNVDIYVENVFNTTKYHDLLPALCQILQKHKIFSLVKTYHIKFVKFLSK